MGEYLKNFELNEQYDAYKETDYSIPYTTYVTDSNKVHYYTDVENRDYSKEYFTIESLEDGNDIIWKATTTQLLRTIEISLDFGKTWQSYKATTEGVVCTALNRGQFIWVKGANTHYGQASQWCHFEPTKQYIVYGNIMSLIGGDNFKNTLSFTVQYPVNRFFNADTNIISAENLVLPATTLVKGTYEYMFYNCINLKYAPKELPDATGGDNVYNSMFYNCTNLETTPILKRTVYSGRDCINMFYECRKIKELQLPQEISCTGTQTFCRMCYNCRNLEHINNTLNISIRGTTSSTFEQTFMYCYSLEGPLTLIITRLNGSFSNTFKETFSNCTSLDNVSISADVWEALMFNNCSNLTNFIVLKSPSIVQYQVLNGTNVQLTNEDIEDVTIHEGRYYTQGLNQIEPLYSKDVILSWGYFGNDIFTPFSKSTEAFDYNHDTKVLTIKAKIIAPPRNNNNLGHYYYCKKVQGENVELIKECAFKDFYDLEEVDLPNAWINSTGWYIFQRCPNLKKVRIAGFQAGGGEYCFSYMNGQFNGGDLQQIEFTQACNVSGQGNTYATSHCTYPNKALHIILPDDLCTISNVNAHHPDTLFYVSSQEKIDEYLAYSNWANIGAERFKLKSELPELDS